MNLTYPSRNACLQLMDEYHMLPNIREHSFLVMEVGVRLGEALVSAGYELDLGLLKAGALLHDIAKTACLGNGHNHAQMGADWLQNLGYPAVAQIVLEHVYLSRSPTQPHPPGEIELVNYADKRVRHAEVVTLAERFADLRVRYGRNAEAIARINHNENRTVVLEEKIFAHLAISPQYLLDLNNARSVI
jgi:uncharacterized protein